MAELDRAILEQVTEECPNVLACKLENLLHHINREYSAAKRIDDTVDFEKIRDQAIERCGLWDLLIYKHYQSAVGKYYALRKAHLKPVKREPGQVFEADRNSALIAGNERVSIRFRALKVNGKLEFKDVDMGKERYAASSNSTFVTEDEYIYAKRRALAVMNSHRGYR